MDGNIQQTVYFIFHVIIKNNMKSVKERTEEEGEGKGIWGARKRASNGMEAKYFTRI